MHLRWLSLRWLRWPSPLQMAIRWRSDGDQSSDGVLLLAPDDAEDEAAHEEADDLHEHGDELLLTNILTYYTYYRPARVGDERAATY